MLTVGLPTEVEATFAHELHTPLTSIRGFVATLLQAGEGSFDWETQAEFLDIVDAEAERLGRMIDDYLDVVRLQNGLGLKLRFTRVDLDLLIPRVVCFRRERCTVWNQDERVEIVIDVEPLGAILADQGRIEQVLDNLLSNAFVMSPHGGTITVKGMKEEDGVRISIRDLRKSPAGVQPHRILHKIFRLDRRIQVISKVISLDRYLVERLIEGHGGRIWVESDFGHGSTVLVWLPKDGPPEEEVKPAEPEPPSPNGGNGQ